MGEEEVQHRCFVGGLSWSTSDGSLKEAFRQFGQILEAKVVVDKATGRSQGFGFVTYVDERAMDEAIDQMHGMNLDGRSITVAKARSSAGGDGDRAYGGGGGRNFSRGSQDCFKCGKPGHWARECPNDPSDGRSNDRYNNNDRYSSRDRYRNTRDSFDGKGGDYYSSGGRYGTGRNDNRYGGRPSPMRKGTMRGNDERDKGQPMWEMTARGNSDRYGGRASPNQRATGRGNADRENRSSPRNENAGYRDRSGPYDRPSGRDSGRR